MGVTLNTGNYILQSLNQSHKADIQKLYKDESVRKFLGGTIEDDAFSKKFETDILDCGLLSFHVRSNNHAFVGLITIDDHHDGQYHEISYQILPEFWGTGAAYETLNATLEYAYKKLCLKDIIAETQTANIASLKLLEKLGMTKIQSLKRFGKEQVIFHKSLFNHVNAA